MSDLSLIMTAAGSIVLLLFLVMKARLHAVVALILVSMVAGLAAGMNPADIANTIQKGMGGTLGFVAVVVALGAMFGKVMEVTGALDRVAHTLLGKFGVKRANWAMALTGFVCALPLFFDVAVVLLIGVAFAIVRRGGGSVVKIGIALLAGIATCQAFLIPAPGPILVASQLGADFGYMILFGLIAAVPALILAGPLFGELISKVVDVPLPESPMTTKVSRVSMSKLAPLMATVQPVLARISLLDRPCSIRGRARFGLGPKTFDRFLMDIKDMLLPEGCRSPVRYGSAPTGDNAGTGDTRQARTAAEKSVIRLKKRRKQVGCSKLSLY